MTDREIDILKEQIAQIRLELADVKNMAATLGLLALEPNWGAEASRGMLPLREAMSQAQEEVERRIQKQRRRIEVPKGPSQHQWQVAQERLAVVRAVERMRDVGFSLARAIDLVRLEMDAAPCPATIRNWIAATAEGGAAALAPKHRGRVRKDYGWEGRAIELWSSPNQPAAAQVARQLVAEGYNNATPSRVRSFLKKQAGNDQYTYAH